MFRTRVVGAGLVALTCVVLLPTAAWAQTATFGSIAGVVKDTSGAVLAGVTVEAASPALIEKVRSVVTDGQGRYQIVDLRPGPYTVTFTLPGFNTFRREGLELSTAFTAVVNADMAVGSLEETVTVTGASPVVDTRNTRTQTVLTKEVLDTLPTGKATGGVTTTGADSSEVPSLVVAVATTEPPTLAVTGMENAAAPAPSVVTV